MNVKQVILIRTHYPDNAGGTRKIRSGKLIAQACHATMKVFFDRGSIEHGDGRILPNRYLEVPLTPEMAYWIENKFTKVILSVKSEADLLEAKRLADEAGIPNALIIDVGRTEFKERCGECLGNGFIYVPQPKKAPCPSCEGTGKISVPTITALALGPDLAEKIDLISGLSGLVKTKLC